MSTGATEQADGKSENDSSIFRSLHHPERAEKARLTTHSFYLIVVCRGPFRTP